MSPTQGKRSLVAAWLVASLGFVGFASAETPEPYPLEYWALRDVIRNVQLSPVGDRLALMKIPSKKGDPIIEVYDTSDLSKDPFRVNADPMEIEGYSWVSNEVIAFSARQAVRTQIEGFNQGVFEYRFAFLNVEEREITKSFDQEEFAVVVNRLPNRPNHIIVAYANDDRDGPDAKIKQAFRPAAYWEYNTQTGTRKLLIRSKLRLGAIRFDAEGRPRLAQGFDGRSGEYIWYYRGEDGSDWEEIHRQHEDDWEQFGVSGLDEENPGLLYVIADNGEDTYGLWSFDPETKKMVEPIYKRNDVDVGSFRYHSNYWANPGVETGVVWWKDKRHIEFWDAEEEAIQRQLEELIPYAYSLRFVRSRDNTTIVIRNSGPRDPGTYYLLKDGKLSTIGSRNPLLESEQLADVRYITYEARDGRMIPGYITVPNSEPPYPLVVLPHGGPFVREVVSYDEWGQMLANHGYLVLQPQYRGSRGHGMEFYQSAFINGGQGGYKMQDDKDDGALYLVEEGLADPERMAMFGWSYGGYAALVAASRTPQLYQCVVAGAAVADNNQQVNHYRFASRGTQEIEQISMWDDSISPIEEASKVNVPMLLIHGDVDQRVEIKHSRKYVKELERYEKNFEYIELEGADHFSNTLTFDHKLTVYGSLTRFLREDCGPGGL